MKRISVTLIALISCLTVFSQEAIDYLNVGKTLKFGKQKYSLAWSSHPADNYYIQEWLPKGENFDNYSQMFTPLIRRTDPSDCSAKQSGRT